jgi:hypothetical protein
LWAIVLILVAAVLFGMSGAGVAQTSDSEPRAASPDGGPPPGGCNPIGLTVSGEIVFPMTCKEFIERYKAADRNSSAAETKPATAEGSKASAAAEAGKAQTTGEASKAPAAVEADKAPTTAEASKIPAVIEADKPSSTVAANKAPAAAEVGNAPAAVEAGKAPTTVEASKTPGAADPGKPDEKDAKPVVAKAQPDEAARPVTKQAAVAPAGADAVKSSAEPATTAAVSKRTRARNHVAGAPGCTRFRTYDAASGTYRDYGGQRRSCP